MQTKNIPVTILKTSPDSKALSALLQSGERRPDERPIPSKPDSVRPCSVRQTEFSRQRGGQSESETLRPNTQNSDRKDYTHSQRKRHRGKKENSEIQAIVPLRPFHALWNKNEGYRENPKEKETNQTTAVNIRPPLTGKHYRACSDPLRNHLRPRAEKN